MDSSWHEYRLTLVKELGDELASEFVASLYSQSLGSVEVANQFFYELGARWAPLLYAWSGWVGKNSQDTIAIILRDAKPLGVLPATKSWKRLYLNRLTCGVPDELSGDVADKQHPLLRQYLRQHGCSRHFTFVDTGCYGTVVLELHRLGMNFQPLFFFSKNPSIRGFLNEAGISMADAEILNDSLECGFPHTCARPSELVKKEGSIEVVLRPTDALSVKFGEAAMLGVSEARISSPVSAREAAQYLLALSQVTQRGEFTGILSHTSPEWSKKKEFLANWPKHLCWV